MEGKLDKEFVVVVFALFDVPMLPQVFDDDIVEPLPAVLQLIPELCVLLVYEGIVDVGDVILFILMAGRICCCC
jgi:hypothetical protein